VDKEAFMLCDEPHLDVRHPFVTKICGIARYGFWHVS